MPSLDATLRPTVQILVVCSGNICRSPYAEAYLRHCLQEISLEDTAVDSAGILGIVGSPASPETVEVAQESGLELNSHQSKGINFDRVDEADIILVMEEMHRSALAERYPEDEAKVFLLSEFHPSVKDAARAPDIFDPIGLPIEEYRRCFSLVRDAMDGFVSSRFAPRD